MDIIKGLEMVEKMKQANKRYYMKKNGLTDAEKDEKLIEQAKRRLEAYERQKERQRQKRKELGKVRGRPFKTKESEERAATLLIQLNEVHSMTNVLDTID